MVALWLDGSAPPSSVLTALQIKLHLLHDAQPIGEWFQHAARLATVTRTARYPTRHVITSASSQTNGLTECEHLLRTTK